MLVTMDDVLFLLGGIPLHPIVIHVVVVLTPLLALGLVLAVAVARVRTTILGFLVVGLGVTTAFSFSLGRPERRSRKWSAFLNSTKIWAGCYQL